MTSTRLTSLAVLVLAGLLAPGCATKAGTGAAIGAGAGAAAGGVIGHQKGKRTEGALIGAALGAVGGYLIGDSKDDADAQLPVAPERTDETPAPPMRR